MFDFDSEGRLSFLASYGPGGPGSGSVSGEDTAARLEWFRTERLPSWLSHFEHCLSAAPGNGAAFFFSLRLTYADLAVFHALCEAAEQFPEHYHSIVPQIPLLTAFVARIKLVPGIARYLSSGRKPLHRNEVSEPEPPAPQQQRPVRAPRSLVLGLPLLQAAAIVADAAAAAAEPPSGLPTRRRRRTPTAKAAEQESPRESSSSSNRKFRASEVHSI